MSRKNNQPPDRNPVAYEIKTIRSGEEASLLFLHSRDEGKELLFTGSEADAVAESHLLLREGRGEETKWDKPGPSFAIKEQTTEDLRKFLNRYPIRHTKAPHVEWENGVAAVPGLGSIERIGSGGHPGVHFDGIYFPVLGVADEVHGTVSVILKFVPDPRDDGARGTDHGRLQIRGDPPCNKQGISEVVTPGIHILPRDRTEFQTAVLADEKLDTPVHVAIVLRLHHVVRVRVWRIIVRV